MKKRLIFTLSLLICFTVAWAQSPLTLFYEQPAQKWVEALPLGNGRLGAMVYGGVGQEHVQFNEETLWKGEPHDYTHEGAHKYLAEVRQLLEEGKQDEAEALANREFMSQPLRQMPYQPFGDLIVDFPDHQGATNYRRLLDLEKALCTVSYSVDGVDYRREFLVSHPQQMIVMRLEASQAGALNFSFHLNSVHFQKSVQTEGDMITLDVRVEESPMMGTAKVVVKTDGQTIPTYEKIEVRNATHATLYLDARTNFVDYKQLAQNTTRKFWGFPQKVQKAEYEAIKAEHIDDYSQYFKRFSVDFGDAENLAAMPTDQRIYRFWKNPDDPQLLALYVQYARYLMLSSSRVWKAPAGIQGQPANLQGIWNHRLDPSWGSKWTVNINTEMNFWPAEVTNLSEMHQSLFKLIEECAETGKKTAKEHYGCDGWVLHHNTDIWRGTAPINASNHGIWVGGSAWLCTHMWEHYLFTQDRAFLEEKYPIMRDAALFYSQFLVEDPETGYLISTPSNSPETGGLVAGPTMDHQLIRALFQACIEASSILQTDEDFAETLKAMQPKIAPNQIGKHGQLQEWLEDKDDPDNKHRHVSHLWGLHPGNEINREETPELVEAAKKSLLMRGDEGTGWSLAWKINFWARFLDGNHAFELIHMLLSPAEEPERNIRGGSYPNLFDAHPPFQIDGNFGGAAGILEMLLQSHLGKIDLLPALPDALPQGNISGIKARDGFELAFTWDKGKLEEVTVLSTAGNPCALRYQGKTVEFETEEGGKYVFDGRLRRR